MSIVPHIQPWLVVAKATLALAAVALLIFPSRYSEYGLLAIGLALLLGWLGTGRLWQGTALDLPVAAIILIALASWLWVAADRNLSWIAFCQLTAGVTTFWVVAQTLRTRQAVLTATALLLAFGVGLALYGLAGSTWWQAQKFLTVPATILRWRPHVPEVINANILGGALLPLLVIASALLLFGRQRGSRRRRWFSAAGLALAWLVMAAMLGLTQSRGAWLACAVAVILLALFRTRWAVLLIPLSLLILLQVGPSRAVQFVSAGQALSSWESRQEVWSRALYMIQDFPFTGIGIGAFGRVAPILYPFFIGSNEEGAIAHAHNLFLQVAVDLGVFGLVAFVALFTASLFAALRTWRLTARVDHNLAAVGVGLAAALLAVLIHGLLDSPLWAAKTTVILWAILGLSVAACQAAETVSAAEQKTDGGEADGRGRQGTG